MEVHHHPHVEKKKFKEYFLEFIMIFLAVTLGFIAENIREHFVDKRKEREIIIGLIDNMRSDTAQLNQLLSLKPVYLGKMDSCLAIPVVSLKDINKQDTFFHHFSYFFDFTIGFSRNDITFSQLGNGGYSLIGKKSVRDSISALNIEYYTFVNGNVNFLHHQFTIINDFAPSIMRIIKYPVLRTDSSFNQYLHNTPVFTRLDPALLEQLYGYIRVERVDIEQTFNYCEMYKNQTARLIKYLQKEYNLNDE